MAADVPFEFKMVKSLEWCTEIPAVGRPRESPVFLLNGNEWFFLFEMKNYGFGYLYIKLKKKNIEVEPCSVNLHVGFKYENALSLCKKLICIKSDLKEEVWNVDGEELYSKLPPDYSSGNCMKLVFRFDSTVELHLKTNDGLNDESVQSPDTNTLLESMSKDFSKLLDDGLNHDVEFLCGDETYKAHKNILSCRSDVLSAMLQSDMVEGKTGRITIQDIDATTFQQFLKCMYSGKLEELTIDTAVSLYKVGDKYHVDSLKKHCAEYLIINLTPENFSDSLMLADLHDDTEFKKSIMEYIIKRKIHYSGEKWTDFCKKDPVLANEVLNFFCQQIQPK